MSREEDHIVKALIELCQHHAITCLVQVGAEDGYEAEAIRAALGCRAVALDPDPKCVPISPKLEFHEVMIGAANSIVPFYLNAESGLSSQVQRKDGGEIVAQMPQHRLDDFCIKRGITPDALIIDTEGTTLDVLAGAERLLGGVNVIYAECAHAEFRPGIQTIAQADAFLAPRGFTAHQGLPSYDAGNQGNYTWVRA